MGTSTQGFRVVPVTAEVAREVRQTRKAPRYGHPAHQEVASGYGPCRVCLKPLAVNTDEVLLVTYDPFVEHEPFPLPSPIHIHADTCYPYPDADRFPDRLRFIPMTLNAYGAGAVLVDQVRIDDAMEGRLEHGVEWLFANPAVTFVHVRNTAAGCFIVHLDRP